MSVEICSGCDSGSATFVCISHDSSLPHCVKCVRKALSSSVLSFFACRPQSAAVVSAPCSVCRQRAAEEVCVCVFPPKRLCEVCKLAHVAPVDGILHEFFPAREAANLSERQITQRRHDRVREFVAEETLKGNLFTITECERKMKERIDSLEECCARFSEEQTNRLSHLKKELQEALNRSLVEAKEQILNWEGALSPFTQHLVSNWNDKLQLFRCQECEPDIDLTGACGIRWESRIDGSGRIKDDFQEVQPEKTQNPLAFADIHSFLAACGNLRPIDANRLRVEYYKAHMLCLQAMDEAFFEVVRTAGTDEDEEKWREIGLAALREKVPTDVPSAYEQQLESLIKEAYMTQSKVQREKCRNSELTSIMNGLSEELEEVPKKRGRGRPPKNKLKKK